MTEEVRQFEIQVPYYLPRILFHFLLFVMLAAIFFVVGVLGRTAAGVWAHAFIVIGVLVGAGAILYGRKVFFRGSIVTFDEAGITDIRESADKRFVAWESIRSAAPEYISTQFGKDQFLKLEISNADGGTSIRRIDTYALQYNCDQLADVVQQRLES